MFFGTKIKHVIKTYYFYFYIKTSYKNFYVNWRNHVHVSVRARMIVPAFGGTVHRFTSKFAQKTLILMTNRLFVSKSYQKISILFFLGTPSPSHHPQEEASVGAAIAAGSQEVEKGI